MGIVFNPDACKTCDASCCKDDPRRAEKGYVRLNNGAKVYSQQGKCPYLSSKGDCMIYPVRPDSCREYPYSKGLTKEDLKLCPGCEWQE